MLSWIWWITNRLCWQFQSFRDLMHGMQLVAKKSWKLVGVTHTRVPTCLLKGSVTPGWCMGWSQMSTNLLCFKMECECPSQNIPREFDHLTLGMSSLRVPGRDCLWSTRLFFGFRCLPTIRTLHAWHWQFAVMLSNPFLQSHFQWDGVHCVELKFGSVAGQHELLMPDLFHQTIWAIGSTLECLTRMIFFLCTGGQLTLQIPLCTFCFISEVQASWI